jgi:nucleotide-binding universal stress UspA family protein
MIMSGFSGPPIVVGIDGSPSAVDAALWGAREANERRSRLHLVYAYEWADGVAPGRAALRANTRYRDVFLQCARESVQEAAGQVRVEVPDVAMSTELVVGRPVELLTERSTEASLVVVGSRGLGGVSGLLLGSVSVGLVSHAKCPVVVVRGEEHRSAGGECGSGVGAPVVVGLDGSPMSEAALAYAYDAASAYGSPLVAVHAWHVATEDSRLFPYIDQDAVREDEDRLLAEQVAGWGEKYPDVLIRREVVDARPAHALLDQSAHARLLVVGARGRGGMAGLLLGSTSQALIQRASCPVAVVRQGDRP